MRFILFCLLTVTTLATAHAKVGGSDIIDGSQAGSLAKANSFYDKGDCQSALPLFLSALKSSAAPGDRDVALFKSAYCQLSLGQNDQASSSFRRYLELHPDNEEARLRLSQALLMNQDYTGAQSEAQKVKDQQLKPEAAIFIARAAIATQDYGSAIAALGSVRNAGNWNPVLLYWQGIALYNLDEIAKAKRAFSKAEQAAPESLWVRTEAKKSLENLESEQRRLRGFLTVGYLTDSNVFQSGDYLAIAGTTGSATTYDKTDRGATITGETTWLPVLKKDSVLAANVYYSSPFYEKNPSYDYQSLAAEIALRQKVTQQNWLGLAASYSGSYYNGVHYQDYEGLTPTASWNVNQNLYLDLSVPFTFGVVTRISTSVGPSLGAQYTFSPAFSLRGTLNYSKTTGADAVYTGSGSSTTYASGQMFSNYSTIGASLGFNWAIFEDIFLSGQVSMTKTDYKAENLPASVNVTSSARADKLLQAQVELSSELVKNKWSVGLGLTTSSNDSSGFQGLASSGYTSNYTYKRNYALLRTTLLY